MEFVTDYDVVENTEVHFGESQLLAVQPVELIVPSQLYTAVAPAAQDNGRNFVRRYLACVDNGALIDDVYQVERLGEVVRITGWLYYRPGEHKEADVALAEYLTHLGRQRESQQPTMS